MALFSAADFDRLMSPHICRAWFARFALPTGDVWLHSGVGRVTVDGIEWTGVTDPLGGRLLSVGQVVEPRFGEAAAITFTLTGVSADFLTSIWNTRHALEGRAAEVWWAALDQETQDLVIERKALFPGGRMTSPKIFRRGPTGRSCQIVVESLYSTRNFPPGGRWNPADQHRRYPGDKGFDFIGQKITEVWK